jgi:hypothetical protein
MVSLLESDFRDLLPGRLRIPATSQAWWLISIIPATQEAEIVVQCHSGQKVSEIPSQQISRVWWCKPVTPATQEEDCGPKPALNKSWRLSENKLKQKGLGT